MREVFANLQAYADFGVLLKDGLTLLALCSIRMYAIMLVLPATNDQSIQGIVRNGVALTAGLFVAWGMPVDQFRDATAAVLMVVSLKEAVIGIVLGFAASTVFWVAEAVGALIDNQAGFNNAQLTHPMTGEQSTPVSNLVSQVAIVCFFLAGGMQGLLAVLFDTYRWWPLDALAPAWSTVLEDFVRFHVRQYMEMIVKLSAPVMLVLLLVDLAFGLLSKTADKLEPNNLAQPIKGALTMFMCAIVVVMFFNAARPDLAMVNLAKDVERWVKAAQP